MICKKCGAAIPDDASFCNICGEPQQTYTQAETTVLDSNVYQAPTYEQPVYQQPVVEQPVYQQPVVEQPVYQQPVVEQPVYQQPVVEQPAYEAPVYQAPAYEAPTYEAPATEPVFAEAPSKSGGKGLAITSLILGIVSVVLALGFICCCGTFSSLLSIVPAVIGLILAVVAKKKGATGGLCKAGLILSVIALVISVVLLLISIFIFIMALASSGGDFEMIIEEFMEGFEEGFNAGYNSSYYDSYYAVKSVVSSFLK